MGKFKLSKRDARLFKLKLKKLCKQLKKNVKQWKRTKKAKALKAQLIRMKYSPLGRKLQKNGKKLGKSVEATAKSFKKLGRPGFRQGFHVSNKRLWSVKKRVNKHIGLSKALLKAPVSKGLKFRAKKAFNNRAFGRLKRNLKRNAEVAFHMSPAQERLAEAHKKKIGMMIKQLAAYMKKTARVTNKPKGWHMEE